MENNIKEETKTFEKLLEEGSADLSIEDKEWLVKNNADNVVKKLESCFEELKRQVPGRFVVIKNRESIIIPAVDESIVDAEVTSKPYKISEKPFVSSFSGGRGREEWIEFLYEQYPSQEQVKLIPKKLSKEVDWSALVDTFGDRTKLREQALTPKQVEHIIRQVEGYEKGKRFEYLVCMEGYEYTKMQHLTDGPRVKVLHILRIFVGEMREEYFDKPHYRHIDWDFLGSIYPLEVLPDGLPVMRASGCWNDRTFEDSIILLKE